VPTVLKTGSCNGTSFTMVKNTKSLNDKTRKPHTQKGPLIVVHFVNAQRRRYFSTLLNFGASWKRVVNFTKSLNDKTRNPHTQKGPLTVLHFVHAYRRRYFSTLLNFGASWKRVVNCTSRPLYPRQRTTVPIEYAAGWVPTAGPDVTQNSRISCPLNCNHTRDRVLALKAGQDSSVDTATDYALDGPGFESR